MEKEKLYIKRWKQTKFNPKQILDTQVFMENPNYINFPIDCIFSIDKHGDCTFYMEQETIQKCNEFGYKFDWEEFMVDLGDIGRPHNNISLPEIIEYYFMLQPEITEYIQPDIADLLYSSKEWFYIPELKKLKALGYVEKPKGEYNLMEVLALKRIILRDMWETPYYKKKYSPFLKETNIRLHHGVKQSIISQFNGIEEPRTGIYYKFSPHGVTLLSGIVCKLDENMKQKEVDKILSGKESKILVVPNARPELVKYFDTKGLVGFLSEEGGATSHSIVIARERNIPCAVGIPGIMKQVENGDRIEIDLSTDKITIHRGTDG